MNNEDKNNIDIISVLTGDADKFKINEFSTWLSKSKQNQEKYKSIKKMWELSKDEDKRFDIEKAWENINITNVENKKRRVLNLNLISKVAAVLLLFFSVYTSYKLYNIEQEESQELTFSTDRGDKSVVFLPDGSKVKLNADTKIKYKYSRVSNKRNVELNGEAYFEVEKSDKPFIVHTRNTRVKVYGTIFNVRGYAEDNLITTSLKEGSVGISFTDSSTREVMLKPGYQATYQTLNHRMKVDRCNLRQNFGWVDNKIIVDNEDLESLCKKLERQYDVKIRFRKTSIGDLHYTGVFEDETIEEIMKAICKTSKVRYKVQGKSILLY